MYEFLLSHNFVVLSFFSAMWLIATLWPPNTAESWRMKVSWYLIFHAFLVVPYYFLWYRSPTMNGITGFDAILGEIFVNVTMMAIISGMLFGIGGAMLEQVGILKDSTTRN